MVYYQCKCGDCQSWSSMGPTRCFRCPKCKSNLAEGIDLHDEPEPHIFDQVILAKDDDGNNITGLRCRYCRKSRKMIDKETQEDLTDENTY